MKFAALIRYTTLILICSGGKDSIFTIIKCIEEGHELCVLANLYPSNNIEELDSFMYQSVGHDAIPFISESLRVPLVREMITGTPILTNLEYEPRDKIPSEDEVEDLFRLLEKTKKVWKFHN